jgi:two-component system chemotaxis response regulator CheB
MRKPVRVLVVDDSALMRKLIPKILEQDASIEVVGTAIDGNFGLKKIDELSPDVVTLDLEMPGLNGIDTLERNHAALALPVIVVSSHSTAGRRSRSKRWRSVRSISWPSPKDVSARMPEIAGELIKKIRAAAQSAGVHSVPAGRRVGEAAGQAAPGRAHAHHRHRRFNGRPERLAIPFLQLPVEFSGSILVVQHMPDGFTELFAKRLDESCPIRVKEAQSGDLLVAGTSAHLSREPAHESKEIAARQRGVAGR